MESWRHFSKAAGTYAATAALQQNIGEALRGLLPLDFKPASVLDVGCGDGEGTALWQKRFPQARFEAWDRAPGMVAKSREKLGDWVTLKDMDEVGHPAASGHKTYDLIYSNLALQWSRNPGALVAGLGAHLAFEGYMALSIFLGETGKELGAAAANMGIALDRGPGFQPERAWADHLHQCGLSVFYTGLFQKKETFEDGGELLKHLQAMGAHTGTRGPLSPGKYRGLVAALGKPATYTWAWGLFIARNLKGGP